MQHIISILSSIAVSDFQPIIHMNEYSDVKSYVLLIIVYDLFSCIHIRVYLLRTDVIKTRNILIVHLIYNAK